MRTVRVTASKATEKIEACWRSRSTAISHEQLAGPIDTQEVRDSSSLRPTTALRTKALRKHVPSIRRKRSKQEVTALEQEAEMGGWFSNPDTRPLLARSLLLTLRSLLLD